MTDICMNFVDLFACPYDCFENLQDDAVVIERFNELTIKSKAEGFTPLMVIPSDTLWEAVELALEDADLEVTTQGHRELIAAVLAKVDAVDTQALLSESEKLAELLEEVQDLKILETEPTHCFFSIYDGAHIAPEVLLFQIPTANPWELAAWVPMGGFNDCPQPEEQVAVFRKWHNEYCAVPAVVAYDVWELEVATPAETAEQAIALAKEMYCFCMDTIDQASEGWDSLAGLASTILHSTTWFFWWD